MAYLLVPDTQDGAAATTDVATVPAVTGDLEVRLDLMADSYGAIMSPLAYNATGDPDGDGWYIFILASSSQRFFWRDASNVEKNLFGGAELSSNGVSAGTRFQLKMEFDVDNGSSQHEIGWYYRTDGDLEASSGWTQLASGATGAGTTAIKDNSADSGVAVGGWRTDFNGNEWDGRIYRAQIYDGIDGTLVFDADFSDPTTWTFN